MEIRTLHNGLTVVVLENHGTPLVTVELDVKNGSFTEGPEWSGLSHLYEHMFFKANASLPSQERYLARLRELGAEFNGTTSTERVNYFITLHASRLREGIEFMIEAIRTPLFDPVELERERAVVLAEYDRLESMPRFHLQRACGELLWGREHFSRKNPIGDRRIIATATPEKLRQIQQRYYVPNNAALLLSGDVEPEEAFELAAQLCGAWPRGLDPFAGDPVPFPAPLACSAATLCVQPVRTLTVRLAWHGPSLRLDPAATHAADLLSYIVGQPNSQFRRRLVDAGLCTAADLSYFSQNYVGPISVHLETSAERVREALDVALAELERLPEPGTITDEEIDNAKARLEVRALFEREDPLAHANAVGFWWATAGLDYYRTYLEMMREVSRAALERVVRRYVLRRPLVIGALAGAEDVAAAALSEAVLLEAAERHRVRQRRVQPKPELLELAGLEVLHKQVPSLDVAAVQLFFKGGTRNYPASEAGIERLLLDAARRGGGSEHSRAAIERFVSRTGSALRVTAAREFSRLSLYCTRAHLAEGLDVLLDVAAAPALVPAELELARRRLLTESRHRLANPQSLLGRLAMEQFYRGGAYAADPDGTAESLDALSAERLRAHHERLLVRERLLCVAVGAVDWTLLREQLERRLASTPHGSGALPPLAPPAGLHRPQFTAVARAQPTNHVLALFAGPAVGSDEYPAFFAALDFLGHRLFEEVRTKRNLAYSVSAAAGGLVANHGRIALVSAEPQKSLEVVAGEIARLRRVEVEPAELAGSLAQLRTGLLMQRTRLSGQADELGRAHLLGGHYSRAEAFAEAVVRVSPAQMQSVFQQYLRHFNVVLVGAPAAVSRDFVLTLGD